VAGYGTDVYINRTVGNHVSHIRAIVVQAYGIQIFKSRDGSINHSAAAGHGQSYCAIYFYRDKNFSLLNSKAFGDVDTTGFCDYDSEDTVENTTANGMRFGFEVNTPFAGYKLENNTATNNSQYGFSIEQNEPGFLFQATLIGNTAKNNGLYGFWAFRKVKGKQNHASGNGTNCFHVACSP